MSSVNKVFLLGRVGKDPELRSFPNGDSVCNFSLATSEQWKDKATGEKKESTEWHNIVALKGLADFSSKWLHKGAQVALEGKIRTRKWKDQSGQDRYSTEIIASNIAPIWDTINKDEQEKTQQHNEMLQDEDIPF